jgi:arabinose-5-phosphate isomerase
MTLEYAREVLDIEIAALRKVRDQLDGTFVAALDAMEACGGRVITCGMGKAGQIAMKISATLASTGTPSFFLHPAEALHGDLGMVRADDLMLVFSNSGESGEISALLPFVRAMGVPIIAVTASARSYLAVQADRTILLGDLTEACPLGLAPTATTTAMLVVGDALALCLMKRRGFRIEDYALRHPAGALGRKTLAVKFVMRVGEAVAAIAPERPVREALFAITRARSGAAVVVDQDRRVLGIFCDGDLRRGIEKDPDFLGRPVGEVMTAHCITVGDDLRAGDVLDLLKAKRIGEVPVVDADGILAGVADLKGLVASQ